jgi:CheY-like chemotaxis protein
VALRDGIDALRHLESHRTDVVVLDLGLPRLGGRDVAREMRAHDDTRHIPIIVVTAADTPIGLEADYASVLRKPIEPEALAAVVAHSVKRRR